MRLSERIGRAQAWYLANKDKLPQEPFQLAQARRISDPQKFYRSIKTYLDSRESLSSELAEAYILQPIRLLKAFLEEG